MDRNCKTEKYRNRNNFRPIIKTGTEINFPNRIQIPKIFRNYRYFFRLYRYFFRYYVNPNQNKFSKPNRNRETRDFCFSSELEILFLKLPIYFFDTTDIFFSKIPIFFVRYYRFNPKIMYQYFSVKAL